MFMQNLGGTTKSMTVVLKKAYCGLLSLASTSGAGWLEEEFTNDPPLS